MMDPEKSGKSKKKYNSMLIDASQQKDIKKVKIAVENGADLNFAPNEYHNPLLFACGGDGSYEIAKYLIEKGADTSVKDSDGKTALDHAIEQEFKKLAEYLES